MRHDASRGLTSPHHTLRAPHHQSQNKAASFHFPGFQLRANAVHPERHVSGCQLAWMMRPRWLSGKVPELISALSSRLCFPVGTATVKERGALTVGNESRARRSRDKEGVCFCLLTPDARALCLLACTRRIIPLRFRERTPTRIQTSPSSLTPSSPT